MAVKITIDGLRGLDEVVNVIGNYSTNISKIINGHNAHNTQLQIQKAVRDEMHYAGFNEKGKRSIRLSKAFIFERDSLSVKDNILYNMFIDQTYLDSVEHNKDWNNNQRQGLTGEELISFMEIGRKEYKIPINPKGKGKLVFKNKYTKPPNTLKVLAYSMDKQYTVHASHGGANFELAVMLELDKIFDKVASRIEQEVNKI